MVDELTTSKEAFEPNSAIWDKRIFWAHCEKFIAERALQPFGETDASMQFLQLIMDHDANADLECKFQIPIRSGHTKILNQAAIRELYGHTGVVMGATQLSDGRILSWSDEDSLRLWSKKGKPLYLWQSATPWDTFVFNETDGGIVIITF